MGSWVKGRVDVGGFLNPPALFYQPTKSRHGQWTEDLPRSGRRQLQPASFPYSVQQYTFPGVSCLAWALITRQWPCNRRRLGPEDLAAQWQQLTTCDSVISTQLLWNAIFAQASASGDVFIIIGAWGIARRRATFGPDPPWRAWVVWWRVGLGELGTSPERVLERVLASADKAQPCLRTPSRRPRASPHHHLRPHYYCCQAGSHIPFGLVIAP